MPFLKLESGLYVNLNQVASVRVDDLGNVGIAVPTPIARPRHSFRDRHGQGPPGFEPSALPVYNLSGAAARAVIDYLAGTQFDDLTLPDPGPTPAPAPEPAPPATPSAWPQEGSACSLHQQGCDMGARMRPKRMAGKLSTYWPPGDIMNFWPTLLRVAAERMLPGKRPPWLHDFLARAEVPAEVAQTAILRYIRAMKLAHLDPDVNDLEVACAREGFTLTPPAAQAAVFMLLGELAGGIYIAGVKDATPLGENGIRDDVESLVWAAEEHVRKLRD